MKPPTRWLEDPRDERIWLNVKMRYMLGIGLGLIAAIVLAAIVLGEVQAKYECRHVAAEYHRHTTYSIFGGGCYVEIAPGVSVQLERFNAFKGAR